MSIIKKMLSDRLTRFYMALALSWLLFVCGCIFLLVWSCYPGNTILFVAAAVSVIWLGMLIFLMDFRTVNRYIRPLYDIEEYAAKIANGEFPAPLDISKPYYGQSRQLISALNLIREKLRQNNSARQLQHEKEDSTLKNGKLNAELRSSIMNNIVAELRRPLNIVAGCNFLSENACGMENDELKNMLAQAVGDCEIILGRLMDIGDVSESAGAEINRAAVDTAAFVRNVATAALRTRSGIKVQTRFGGNMPQTLYTDGDLLRNIILMMVRGAAYHAVAGEVLELSCERCGEGVSFILRKTMTGQRNFTLYELFEQYRSGEKVEISGHTEMSILSLLFAETQSGRLGAVFEVKPYHINGTEIILTLHDVSPIHTGTSQPKIHMTGSGAASAGKKRRTQTSGRGILLIGNDMEFAALLGKMTDTVHYRTPEDLPAGLELTNFAAVLLDIPLKMRNNDSGFTPFIRHCESQKVPVMVIIPVPDRAVTEKFAAFGAEHVWSKPLNYAELVEYLPCHVK